MRKRHRRHRSKRFRSGTIYHLHLVVDGELRLQLEDFAWQLDQPKPDKHPNASAAARDLLRTVLGIPTAETSDAIERAFAALGITH